MVYQKNVNNDGGYIKKAAKGYFSKMKYIHFSIDDVGKSLAWLAVNKPKSIYDMLFFGLLNKWHSCYGIKVTLNVYACLENFDLAQIPEVYKREFDSAGDWMRFAYHSKSIRPFIEDELNTVITGYNIFDEACRRLMWHQSDIVRLHFWKASEEQKKFLKSKGVNILIYKDDAEFEYDSNDEFYDQELIHWKNNIRFETDDIKKIKAIIDNKERVVMFTHEWALFDQRLKIENTLKLCSNSIWSYI